MGTDDSLTVSPEDEGSRLDVFVARHREDLSRAAVQRLIAEGHIRVTDEPARASLRLRSGSVVSVVVPPPVPVTVEAEEIPLEVVYEDADVIVVNKPAGLVVHPGAGNARGTLVNALLAHCDDLSGIGGELRPGIVHRLDKETSGLLAAAKNDLAHRSLAAQLKARTMHREYWALVWGVPKPTRGEIDLPIGRHPVHRQKMAVRDERFAVRDERFAAGTGRTALTRYEVLEDFGRCALVACRLATGRTHQIRVHMAHLGHPLLGDPLYGRQRLSAQHFPPELQALLAALPGQALHARTLGFHHPRTGEELLFSHEPPEPFMALLGWLREHPVGATQRGRPAFRGG
jgi:23S rRNA pseudouridine1911/1915/1917 synthase